MDEPFGKYWWIFAIVSALLAVGLVLWRLPSLRARFVKKPVKKIKKREPESDFESDSDDGELGEERLLAHLEPREPEREPLEPEPEREQPEPECEREQREQREPEPKKRGRKRAA
jgi:hypothetical protein